MSIQEKIAEAVGITREAIETHLEGRDLVGRVVLFSGGNDSTTLAHLLTHNFPADLAATHAAHANTTIGVEATRQFVRDTSAAFGLPLIEKRPAQSYAELVTEQGFPGPAMHFKMYQRLKERCLRQVRRELVANSRRQRVLFIAGRRRSESARRTSVPLHERDGSVIWASPIALWTKDDLNAYREEFAVPRNLMADELGMSGECLCGAFAEPGEFERIAHVCPEVAQEIVELEAAAAAAGVPAQKCQWGWGAYRADPSSQPVKVGPLCSSCDARYDVTAAIPAPRSETLTAIIARRKGESQAAAP